MKIFLISIFYFINSSGFVGDFEPVVDAIADNPNDLIFGIDKNRGGFLLKSGETQIVKEIRNEFCAAHPERTETVALLPETGF